MVSKILANSKPLSLFNEGLRNLISIAPLMRRLKDGVILHGENFCLAGIHRMTRERAMFMNG